VDVAQEIEYHRQALEALADVGAFINYLAQQPIQSILKHTRGDTTARMCSLLSDTHPYGRIVMGM
jgi:hypothetical protein